MRVLAMVSAMPAGTTMTRQRSAPGLATKARHNRCCKVDVFGQRYALNVYQHADNLWIAVGEFLGHRLRTIERTELKAARAWQKAAIEKALFDDGQTDGNG